MPDFQTNINIHETINSGQVFLWENYKNTWFGIDGYNVVVVKQKPSKILTLSKNTKNFFRSDDEFKKILKSISRDRIVKKAIKAGSRSDPVSPPDREVQEEGLEQQRLVGVALIYC